MPTSLDAALFLVRHAPSVLALLFGLLVGSFSNVCIHRLPREESLVRPRSRCPGCGAPIAAWHNIPILSWLLLRGRCAACKEPISARYPLVEAANGVLWAGLVQLGGVSPRSLALLPFLTALLVLALIDLDVQILPDPITLGGIACGLLASPLGAPDLRSALWSVLAAALAALGGYLAFWAIGVAAERWYGEEALGEGDWKLAAMLGAWLGWRGLLLSVFLGCLAGAVVGLSLLARGGGRRDKLPLGTFLAGAGVLVVFTGDSLLRWYAGLFRV